MALYLEVIEGPESGQKFKLVPGVRMGRTTGEILLSEPKMSALHAQVTGFENSKLYLIDSGSSNGIKLDGKRVSKLLLLPGVIFYIGKTSFRVFQQDEVEDAPAPLIETDHWIEILKTHIPHLQAQNSSQSEKILPFSSLIELHFIEGVQADRKVTLGYGPRKAGQAVLDIELQDPISPEIAFEIRPLEDGTILFQTVHSDIVLLNDTSLSAESLKSGDQIRIGSSLIEVRFIS
jgi:hypothetical protein